ncbi:MAG: trigger factor family protein, partial [Myxococcota bacterium]|nr:trigger factor family protein [Myxococcota bacterium]
MTDENASPEIRVDAQAETPVLHRLEVEVDASRVKRAFDRAYRDLARQARVKGFRPGKAPRQLLEARLGTSAGRHEAIQEAVPGYYRKAVIEHAVDAID